MKKLFFSRLVLLSLILMLVAQAIKQAGSTDGPAIKAARRQQDE